MSYTFVKITSFYRNFLRDYYRENAGTENFTYQEQFDHLMAQKYGYSDFFARHFREIDVNAHEIIYNAAPLQKAWARENGSRKDGLPLIIEQLKKIRPEVVMFQDSTGFTAEFIRKIRGEVKSVRIVTGLYCSPYTTETLRSYREYDFLLCCSPAFKQIITEQGGKSYLFYHSFEKKIAGSIDQPGKDFDLIFAGSFVTQKDFHSGRLEFIGELLDHGIDLKIIGEVVKDAGILLYGKQAVYLSGVIFRKLGLTRILARMPVYKKFMLLNEMPGKTEIPERMADQVISKPVFGKKMYEFIARSRIGLNIHAGIAGDYAANIRLFEITGMGSLLLTERKKNISDLFVPGEEIVVYDSAEDCAEKIHWLLDHEQEMEHIARRGQDRTFREHSVESRVGYLDQIIRENFENQSSRQG